MSSKKMNAILAAKARADRARDAVKEAERQLGDTQKQAAQIVTEAERRVAAMKAEQTAADSAFLHLVAGSTSRVVGHQRRIPGSTWEQETALLFRGNDSHRTLAAICKGVGRPIEEAKSMSGPTSRLTVAGILTRTCRGKYTGGPKLHDDAVLEQFKPGGRGKKKKRTKEVAKKTKTMAKAESNGSNGSNGRHPRNGCGRIGVEYLNVHPGAPHHYKEVAEAIKQPHSRVNHALAKMAQDGEIQRIGTVRSGTYASLAYVHANVPVSG